MHILTHMHTIFTHNYTITQTHTYTLTQLPTCSHAQTRIYMCHADIFAHAHMYLHTYILHMHNSTLLSPSLGTYACILRYTHTLKCIHKGMCLCDLHQPRYNHKVIKTFPHSYIHRLFITNLCTFTYSTAIFPESNHITRRRDFLAHITHTNKVYLHSYKVHLHKPRREGFNACQRNQPTKQGENLQIIVQSVNRKIEM